MIGIKIALTSSRITLSQEYYIEKLAERFDQSNSAPVYIPENPSDCLHGPTEPLDTSSKPYMSLVGSLLWVRITRPDVQTAVGLACSHSANPTMSHWRAALRILRYLFHTHNLDLVYPILTRPLRVSAFVDAGYGHDIGYRSRRGHLVMLSKCPVIRTMRATSMICQSTVEAEFQTANECVKDVLWLRGLLQEIGFPSNQPSVILEDNQVTIVMIKNHVVSARNRYFCIRMTWLRKQVAAYIKPVEFVHVPSKDNLTDIFTKSLPEKQFRHLRDMLMSNIDDREKVSTGGVSEHV